MKWLLPALLVGAALEGAAPKLEVSISVEPAKARPGDQVELRLDLSVKKGWHIYSPDFRGTGKPTQLTVEPGPLAPDGKLKFPDPKREKFFGEEMLVHEGKFRYTQPLKVAADTPPGTVKVRGKLSYMACSSSVCDPPTEAPVEAEVTVLSPPEGAGRPAAGAPAAPEAPAPALPDLDVLLGGGGPGSAPRAAFKLAVEPAAGGRAELVVSYEIPPGYHIYGPDDPIAPTRIIPDEKLAKAAGKATAKPPSKDFRVPGLDEVSRILEKKGEIRQSVTVLSPPGPPEGAAVLPGVQPGKISLAVTVDYQICNDAMCFPAKYEGKVDVEFAPGGAGAAGEEKPGAGEKAAGEAPAGGAKAPEAAGGAVPLGWLALIGQALLWGLFALLMPCTYPMIPITISFFTKQAETQHKKVLNLALFYGAGIVLDFVLIGLVVGPPIVDFATHPAVNAIFAVLFIVFGLSLLGLFEIRLPSSVNALAGRAAGAQGYLGVFILGTTFVITSFTCNVPLVGAMLAGGAQAKSFLQIVVGMGLFGLTMALPFVALAIFPNRVRSLPRSGEWMHTLKVTLGFLEIAAALKFISNVDVVLEWKALPRELFLYIIAAIGITTAIYLFGIIRLHGESGQIGPLRMVFGLGFMVASLYCVYATHVDRLNWVMEAILPPYSNVGQAPAAVGREKAGWTIVEDDFPGGLEVAKKEGKLALLNWTGIT